MRKDRARQRAQAWDIDELYNAASRATPQEMEQLLSPLRLDADNNRNNNTNSGHTNDDFYRRLAADSDPFVSRRPHQVAPKAAAQRLRHSRLAGGNFAPAGAARRGGRF